MKTPPGISPVRRNDIHHLIHSKYSDDGSSVLARIADSEGHLADIFDLAACRTFVSGNLYYTELH